MDGAQTIDEHGGAGMNSPEMGQKVTHRAQIGLYQPFEHPKMSSSETSTNNGRVSGGCADLS